MTIKHAAITMTSRKNMTRRRKLVTAALAADPWAEIYQDVKPCAAGHEKPWRYIKGGMCQHCQANRYIH